jgi:pimeloyl-ACP methyl ester carboxylesterase
VIEPKTIFKPFRERVLALGDEQNLIGIATESAVRSKRLPTVIMLNAGVLHRVGPRRLHVTLSRTLAARGFAACRVDLSGIGDSRVITGHGTFRESAVADTRAFMDHLARDMGTERFVLFGLCSGADNALATAAVDRRVGGLVLIDPPAYPTLRAKLRKARARAARSGALAGLVMIAGTAARFVARALRIRKRSGAAPAEGRQPPPMREYGKLLNELAGRGVRVLCIYSAALHERYNHRDQLFEWFPELRGRIDVEYFGDADHVFTEVASQTRLIDAVIGWLTRSYDPCP